MGENKSLKYAHAPYKQGKKELLQGMQAAQYKMAFLLYMRNRIMKKIIILAFALLMTMNMAYAFSFKINILGYDISYDTPKEVEVIDNLQVKKPLSNADIPITHSGVYETIKTSTIEPKPIHEFDRDIQNLNDIKEVRNTIAELGYSRIGFTDTDSNLRYVALVGRTGDIMSVYQDDAMHADAEIRGSLQKVKDYAYRGDYERLKLAVDVPLKVKLRLLMMRWF